MSNVGRVLTLVVCIEDAEAAKAIWDTHIKHENLAGCKIRCIAEGNSVEEAELRERYVEYLTAYEQPYGTLDFESWKEENT